MRMIESQYLLKTCNVDRMNKDNFEISIEPNFKEVFIAPDESGKWVAKKFKTSI